MTVCPDCDQRIGHQDDHLDGCAYARHDPVEIDALLLEISRESQHDTHVDRHRERGYGTAW